MAILSRNNQSGRSMIEMLGVLAVIGVLSVGGIAGYSKAMAKYKLTKAQDQITILLMNIRTAYATSPTYNGLTSVNAILWNLAPNDMYTSTNASSLHSAFGGDVSITACDATDSACGSIQTASTYFGIKMEGISSEACRSLSTVDWGADGLAGIQINEADAHTLADLPITLSDAGTECNSESNTLIWVYY